MAATSATAIIKNTVCALLFISSSPCLDVRSILGKLIMTYCQFLVKTFCMISTVDLAFLFF